MQHYYDTALVLEGGIVDSIPVQYAMDQGYEHPLVVLTRNKGYNQTMDLIEKLEDEGKITVIRPENPFIVGRMKKIQPNLHPYITRDTSWLRSSLLTSSLNE